MYVCVCVPNLVYLRLKGQNYKPKTLLLHVRKTVCRYNHTQCTCTLCTCTCTHTATHTHLKQRQWRTIHHFCGCYSPKITRSLSLFTVCSRARGRGSGIRPDTVEYYTTKALFSIWHHTRSKLHVHACGIHACGIHVHMYM